MSVIGKPSNCATIHRRAIVWTVLNLSSAGTSQNYTNETSALQSITQSATIPVILQTKVFVLVVNRTAITCVCVVILRRMTPPHFAIIPIRRGKHSLQQAWMTAAVSHLSNCGSK
jgi:hypothetical protein